MSSSENEEIFRTELSRLNVYIDTLCKLLPGQLAEWRIFDFDCPDFFIPRRESSREQARYFLIFLIVRAPEKIKLLRQKMIQEKLITSDRIFDLSPSMLKSLLSTQEIKSVSDFCEPHKDLREKLSKLLLAHFCSLLNFVVNKQLYDFSGSSQKEKIDSFVDWLEENPRYFSEVEKEILALTS